MELNLFSFIPLLLNKVSTNETEASISYFLAQALGSILLLIRITMLFSLYWLKIAIFYLIITAILLKIGAAPCHYWYPTSIEITRWINCLLLSTLQKIGPLFILLYTILPKIKNTIIILIASINALIGGIMGLRQPSLKKIMAYSSITHIGWILRRSATNAPQIAVTYFLFYSIMALPVFIIFDKIKKLLIYELWARKAPSNKWITACSIILLSFGGLPPLTGFIPKLLIIDTLIRCSKLITVILVLGSLLNLFFYLNISLSIIIKNQKKSNPLKSTSSTIITSFILTINLFPVTILLL